MVLWSLWSFWSQRFWLMQWFVDLHGAICLYNKNKGLGLGLRKSILEIRLDGVQPLANLQKYFGKVFQTPFEMLLKPSVTQIGTFYSVCTIWRADFGSLSFYDNYLTKVSWVKFFSIWKPSYVYIISPSTQENPPPKWVQNHTQHSLKVISCG